MIIGLTGSKTFENKRKIKEFIFKLKEYKETEVTIIGMGDLLGADKYVKKYALEMGFIYKEMNAPHTVKNLYSLMSDGYYDKPYTNKNLFLRNQIYCKYIDKCVIFDDTNLTDKKIVNVVNQLTKLRKKAIIITS
jgi:mRNA-degrading endonuclease HigB of HigAB toxin-antitoxin module